MKLLLEHLVRYDGGTALGAGRTMWTCVFSSNLPADANRRLTETRYDPFGRLVSLTARRRGVHRSARQVRRRGDRLPGVRGRDGAGRGGADHLAGHARHPQPASRSTVRVPFAKGERA